MTIHTYIRPTPSLPLNEIALNLTNAVLSPPERRLEETVLLARDQMAMGWVDSAERGRMSVRRWHVAGRVLPYRLLPNKATTSKTQFLREARVQCQRRAARRRGASSPRGRLRCDRGSLHECDSGHCFGALQLLR